MAENDEIVQLNVDPTANMVVQEKAAFEALVDIAHKYKRNPIAVKEEVIAIVSDLAVAKTCQYALPRKNKKGQEIEIQGPSVHLARIITQSFGNIWSASRTKEINATHVVSEAVCIDLEKNNRSSIEVRRSIIGKEGRFSNDMITVNANALNAIAYRNAVFNIIPRHITDAALNAARHAIVGDVSNEQKLLAKRKEIFDQYNAEYGATEAEVLTLCGKNAITGVKVDELVYLINILQALRDDPTTVDDVFNRNTSTANAKKKLDDIAARGNQKRKEAKQAQQNQHQGKPPKQQPGELNLEQK